VNLFELGVEDASDYNSSAFEAMHHVEAVESVDVVSRGENKIAAETLDAVDRARVRGASHRFRLEHFPVRPREGMDVQGALAIGDFSPEDARVLCRKRACQCHHSKDMAKDVTNA